MQVLLALSPCLAVFAAVFVLRWSGVAAGAAAAVTSALLWGMAVFGPTGIEMLGRAGLDAALLTLIVASVIVPGLVFVEVTRRGRAQEAITEFVQSLGLSPVKAALLVTIGIGVFIESLTGMGVSLLVTMPMLLQLAPRRQAIGLGLAGMGLMPWGALALPTLIGAKLAGVADVDFGHAAWLLSCPVMLALPVAVQVFMRGRGVTEVPAVLATSLVLCAAMGLATWSLGVEIAGVLGGLAVIVVLGLGAGGTAIFGKLWAASRMWPYAALVVVAVAQKLVIPVLAARGLLPILSTSRLAWSVLSSPGLALLTAALLASRSNVDSALLVAVGRRAWRPVVATALFLVAARILIEAGGTKALADAAGGLPAIPALVSVGLFGAISGFLTGSGISGNALFMPSAAAIGTSFGNLPVFAALQSAAAGHTALASLPIAAVLLATLPERSKADDRTAMSLGLSIAGANLALLVAWSATLLWAGH